MTVGVSGFSPYNTELIGLQAAANNVDNTATLKSLADRYLIATKGKKMQHTTRRIVQVYIVDPDTKLPLDNAVLFTGEQQLTDSTDEELFFELPIKELIDTHNELRAKTLDKKAKKETYLEPVRIRDLTMTVVTIAEF